MSSPELSTLPEPAEDSFDASVEPQDFPTLEEAEDHLRQIGIAEGFAIARTCGKFNRVKPKVWLKCVAGGEVRNTRGLSGAKRRRQRTSARQGCPFKADIGLIQISPPLWRLTVRDSTHNHSRAMRGDVHHTLRRFTDDEKGYIHTQIWFRTTTLAILKELQRRNPLCRATPRDVTNELARAKLLAWGGKPPLEALLDWLRKHSDDWKVHTIAEEDSGELHGLAFLNQAMIDAVKRWGTVLALDNTYSTNGNAYPLLQVCGMTCTGATFVAGYALIKGEKEPDFTWALGALTALGEWPQPKVAITDRDRASMHAIATTWPNSEHILCRWHVNKAIQAQIKKIFAQSVTRSHVGYDYGQTCALMERLDEVM